MPTGGGQLEIVLRLNADSTGFVGEVKGAEVSVRSLGDEIDGATRATDRNTGETRDNTRARDRNTRETDRNASAVSAQARALATGARAVAGYVAAAAGIGASVAAVARYGDAYTELNNRLRLVTESEGALVATRTRLFEISRDTRTAIEANAVLYSRLSLASSETTHSQGQLLDIVRILNQQIAIGGSNASEAAAGLVQFAQGIASGRLQGDELRSVMENLLGVSEGLIAGFRRLRREGKIAFDVTRANIRDLAAEGVLGPQLLLDAVLASADETEAAFQNVSVTVGAALTNLNTTLVETIGAFDDSTGLSRGLAASLQDLAAGDIDEGLGLVNEALYAGAAIMAARYLPTLTRTVGQAGLLSRASAVLTRVTTTLAGTQFTAAQRTQLMTAALAGQHAQVVALTAQFRNLNRVAPLAALGRGALNLVGGVPGALLLGGLAAFQIHDSLTRETRERADELRGRAARRGIEPTGNISEDIERRRQAIARLEAQIALDERTRRRENRPNPHGRRYQLDASLADRVLDESLETELDISTSAAREEITQLGLEIDRLRGVAADPVAIRVQTELELTGALAPGLPPEIAADLAGALGEFEQVGLLATDRLPSDVAALLTERLSDRGKARLQLRRDSAAAFEQARSQDGQPARLTFDQARALQDTYIDEYVRTIEDIDRAEGAGLRRIEAALDQAEARTPADRIRTQYAGLIEQIRGLDAEGLTDEARAALVARAAAARDADIALAVATEKSRDAERERRAEVLTGIPALEDQARVLEGLRGVTDFSAASLDEWRTRTDAAAHVADRYRDATDETRDALIEGRVEIARVTREIELQAEAYRSVEGPQQRYREQIDALERLRRRNILLDEERVDNRSIDGQIRRLEHQARAEALAPRIDATAGVERALNDLRFRADDVAGSVEQAFTSAFDGAVDALTGFVTTGKLEVNSLADSIIAALNRILLERALLYVVDAIVGTFGSTNVTGQSTIDSVPYYDPNTRVAHSGGIAGALSGARRPVSREAFLGAPRLHTGGIAGDEVPTILRRGEGVFTPEQMAALGPAGETSVRVVIENNGTPQRVSDTSVRRDASDLVVSIVTEDVATGGPISQAFERNHGLRRAPV